MRSKGRVVILTAIPCEHEAIRAKLHSTRPEVDAAGTVYTVGEFAGSRNWEVVLAQVGPGNVGAALHADRAITWFFPDLIMFVGVAGGLKDVALGDVVIGDKVYAYEHGKEIDQFRPRPFTGLSKHRLVDHARYVASSNKWRARLPRGMSKEIAPKALVAPIAAGEKVISSTRGQIHQFLRDQYGDAVAVEMEGIGLLMAAHFHDDHPAIVIRGISDLIAHKRALSDRKWQPLASASAAAFVFEFLSSYGPGSGNGLPVIGPATGPTRMDPVTRLGTRLELGPLSVPPSGLSPKNLLPPGTRINDQFVVERFIGAGAFSAVYSCRQIVGGVDLGQVAVKVHWSSSSQELFSRELIALTSLQHPNLLPYRGAGAIGDPPDLRFTATELAESPMTNFLTLRPMDEVEVVRMGRDIAAGLAYLHREGFVHGDVKPANVLLLKDRWVLGDFGLSRPIHEERMEGTPAFMAPEAFLGHTSPAGDVYALGLTMLVALRGNEWSKRMMTADISLAGTQFALGNELPQMPDDLSQGLRRLIVNCLSEDPSHRPTAEELLAGLLELSPDGRS